MRRMISVMVMVCLLMGVFGGAASAGGWGLNGCACGPDPYELSPGGVWVKKGTTGGGGGGGFGAALVSAGRSIGRGAKALGRGIAKGVEAIGKAYAVKKGLEAIKEAGEWAADRIDNGGHHTVRQANMGW